MGKNCMKRQKFFKFVLSDQFDPFLDLMGLKGDCVQNESWRSHGVAHEVDQNAVKCTKMHKNALQWSPKHNRAECFKLTNMINFFIKWTLERE